MNQMFEEEMEETKVMCGGLDGIPCGNEVEEDNGNFTLELCNSCNETLLEQEGFKTSSK